MSGNSLNRLGNKKLYQKSENNSANLSHDEITHQLLIEMILELKQMKMLLMEAMDMDLEDLNITEL